MSAVIVRIARDTPCPPGFIQQGTATRRTKLCVKETVNPSADLAAAVAALPAPSLPPPSDPAIDDLAGIFGSMAMNQPVMVDLEQLMSFMKVSGGSRRKQRKTRKYFKRRSSRRA
jgi:hypothetical protein